MNIAPTFSNGSICPEGGCNIHLLQILSERREKHAQDNPEAGAKGPPSGARSVLQLH